MLSSTEIIQYLKDNKNLFRKKFHCSEIGLFGSFARNENSANSDVDIVVVFQPNTPDLYDVELQLKEFLSKKWNRKVDICSKKWINPIFKKSILEEAIYA